MEIWDFGAPYFQWPRPHGRISEESDLDVGTGSSVARASPFGFSVGAHVLSAEARLMLWRVEIFRARHCEAAQMQFKVSP